MIAHLAGGCTVPLLDFYLVVPYLSSGCREERKELGRQEE